MGRPRSSGPPSGASYPADLAALRIPGLPIGMPAVMQQLPTLTISAQAAVTPLSLDSTHRQHPQHPQHHHHHHHQQQQQQLLMQQQQQQLFMAAAMAAAAAAAHQTPHPRQEQPPVPPQALQAAFAAGMGAAQWQGAAGSVAPNPFYAPSSDNFSSWVPGQLLPPDGSSMTMTPEQQAALPHNRPAFHPQLGPVLPLDAIQGLPQPTGGSLDAPFSCSTSEPTRQDLLTMSALWPHMPQQQQQQQGEPMLPPPLHQPQPTVPHMNSLVAPGSAPGSMPQP